VNIEQALEMVESLNTDNETGLTTLGANGDEVATLIWQELQRCENKLVEMRKAYNNIANPGMLLDKKGNRSVFDDIDA
jgi:hypothetical protein